MSSLEKRAWFQLIVVALSVAMWLLMFGIFHSAGVSMAAFALLALTALPRPKQTRASLDDHDRAIAESALGCRPPLLVHRVDDYANRSRNLMGLGTNYAGRCHRAGCLARMDSCAARALYRHYLHVPLGTICLIETLPGAADAGAL